MITFSSVQAFILSELEKGLPDIRQQLRDITE
jgi:hypothetical protein